MYNEPTDWLLALLNEKKRKPMKLILKVESDAFIVISISLALTFIAFRRISAATGLVVVVMLKLRRNGERQSIFSNIWCASSDVDMVKILTRDKSHWRMSYTFFIYWIQTRRCTRSVENIWKNAYDIRTKRPTTWCSWALLQHPICCPNRWDCVDESLWEQYRECPTFLYSHDRQPSQW